MEDTKIVGHGMVCNCPHHKILPIILVLIGLDFLLGATGVFTAGFVAVSWPILLIILGCTKMVRCGCCSK